MLSTVSGRTGASPIQFLWSFFHVLHLELRGPFPLRANWSSFNLLRVAARLCEEPAVSALVREPRRAMFSLGVSLRSASFIFVTTGFFFTGMLEDGANGMEEEGVIAELAKINDEDDTNEVAEVEGQRSEEGKASSAAVWMISCLSTVSGGHVGG